MSASKTISRAICLGAASYVALSVGMSSQSNAQSSNLPAVTVDAPQQQSTRRPVARNRANSTASRRQARVRGAAIPAASAAQAAAGERGTGPVIGYSASQSVTSTKTDTPLLETPQSVSVVTKDQIRDQASQSISDALRYTPGVDLQSYGANAFFDAIKIRGFDAPRYLDGLRLPADTTTFAIPKIEPFGLERLEVLKGPSSGIYGQSDPGGLINMISKRPTLAPHYDFEGTFGSFDRLQGAFDIGGPADKNGEFLYRVVGLARQSNSQTDFVQDNKLFIAPSLTWRPTTDTNFTVLSQYQKIDNKGYQQYLPGQVTFLANPNGRVPYGRYIGEPSQDGFKLEQAMIGYAFDHRFDNNLQFRQNVRYTSVTNDLQSVRSEGVTPGSFTDVQRSYNYVKADSHNLAIDNQLQADFKTGPFRHKVLFGLDYLDQAGRTDYRTAGPAIFGGPVPPINAFNPVYGTFAIPSFASLPSFINSDNRINQAGLYAQDQIKLDRWTLSGTIREDFAHTELNSRAFFPPVGSYTRDDNATTGRVGLNYLFDSGISPYANYSTSFVPNANASFAGQAFKPTTGEGMEAGVKFKPVGSNLMLTAAVFEIKQKDVLTADPVNFFFSLQTDAVKATGVELEARGNLTREFEIVGGYTHIDPKVSQSLVPANVGKNLINVALDQASLWGKYTWYDGALSGFGLGGGIRYVGESFGDAGNTFTLPSYTLFDAVATYDFAYARRDLRGWSAQINATNLTNKFYVQNCLTGLAYCALGTSRTVLGTLRYSFNKN